MKNGERPRRDLRERTFKFARQVIKLFVSLDRGVLAQTLGRQMLRAGTSVGANYREADQARSKAEFIAKIGDCLKEADETAYWLELMRGPLDRRQAGRACCPQRAEILSQIKTSGVLRTARPTSAV